MRRILTLVLTTLALATAQNRSIVPLGANGKRVALVIGNDAYTSLPKLTNARNDARAMTEALTTAGFKVTTVPDANLECLELAVQRVIRAIQANDVALFYYSGHAAEVDGQNLLIPVDLLADLDEVQIRNRSLRASEVLERMESRGSALQIIVLDACRNNPFRSFRGGQSAGLATMAAGRGTFIAYASAPGKPASDNSRGGNGLFTASLLGALTTPGLELQQVFAQAGEGTETSSGGKQVPWISHSVRGQFYFVAGGRAIVSSRPIAPADEEVWYEVKDSKRRDLLEEFLKEFPGSQYAGAARLKLRAMAAAPSEPRVAEPVPPVQQPSGKKRVNPRDGLAYVWIPPGTFQMGCSPGDNECYDDEKPSKAVAIAKGFWLGESEVTQTAYQKVVGKIPARSKGSAHRPVEYVSWNEARAYCAVIGGRLPTEEEWEHAARAGSTEARYGDLDRVAWYSANSGYASHPVKGKEPNAWGLYDMLGNVSEWNDGGGSKKPLRGGSEHLGPRNVRASYRILQDPLSPSIDVGFRCAWE